MVGLHQFVISNPHYTHFRNEPSQFSVRERSAACLSLEIKFSSAVQTGINLILFPQYLIFYPVHNLHSNRKNSVTLVKAQRY